MIQDFEDLEKDTHSPGVLWKFIARDYTKSLLTQYMKYVMHSTKAKIIAGLILVVILVLLIAGIQQVTMLHKAHSTFQNYVAFRGCTQIISQTTTSGICKTATGEIINLVKQNDKWYLAGDTGWFQ